MDALNPELIMMYSGFIHAKNITCLHAFSNRLGGVSSGIFESLNLGRYIDGDDPVSVVRNWEIFGTLTGIDTTRFVHGKQVHGNHVHIAGRNDAHGILEPSGLEADGYVTNIPELPLVVFTADCAPLLMQDPEAGVIAAIHCGWRPTAADIESVAVQKMSQLGARVCNIRAAIGPCIRQCCFQTGPEVPTAMRELLCEDLGSLCRPDDTAANKYRLDLPGVIKRRLIQLGLLEEHIDDLGECTMCHPERYWSHRSMGLDRGSQANIIML